MRDLSNNLILYIYKIRKVKTKLADFYGQLSTKTGASNCGYDGRLKKTVEKL